MARRTKKKRTAKKHRRSSSRRGRSSNLVKMPMNRCKHCGMTIFGGDKGLRTHMRKRHRK